MKFWTYFLTSGSLNINASDGAMFISILNDSTGDCNITGGIPFKGNDSVAISLAAGEGVNFSAISPKSPLDGITIDWTSGTVRIIVGFG